MRLLSILTTLTCSILLSITAVSAQQAPKWQLEEINDNSIPPEIVKDTRAPAPNSLPDGRIATAKGDIVEAWYSEPTTRYGHGVLGDAIEAGALRVKNNRGETFTFRLPKNEVFEDITPRIADLDGNGTNEVITILSSQSGGGSVAVFGLNGNAFIKVAQTPFIGRSNRWLNIAEITNFTGGRNPEISIVVTPHLAGLLGIFRLQNGNLQQIFGASGFSNHFIGSNELRLSAAADVNNDGRPDLLIPSLSRNELVMIGIDKDKFSELARVSLPARIDRAIGTREKEEVFEIILGLDDGKTYRVIAE